MSGMSGSSRKYFMKHWFAIEAIPLYAVIGLAVGGASWYLTRLARGPDVVWTRNNKQPWNSVKQGENVKLMSVNQKFDKSSSRTLDMVVPLDSLQPSFELPSLLDIPDSEEDKPIQGIPLGKTGVLDLPEIVFGAASFSNQYNGDDILTSDIPLRTVRLALRYGIRAFDTSAYYGPSEIVLGTVLEALRPEFPRSSYIVTTKCGRYGFHKNTFDYSAETIRKSVQRSLSRLKTDYLDVVYLHDVEFVAERLEPKANGDHLAALGDDAGLYGLASGDEGTIHGPGDQRILDGIDELRKMQAEGVIRYVGITGYPLHTLLRLALLVKHTTGKPLDAILSYSQSNLQNNAFTPFASALRERAEVAQVSSASPLNMGLFTLKVPSWHPAPSELRTAIDKAHETCDAWPGGLANLALGFAMRDASGGGAAVDGAPVVVGLSSLEEVHEAVKVWREIKEKEGDSSRLDKEEEVVALLKESHYYNWAWESPPEAALA